MAREDRKYVKCYVRSRKHIKGIFSVMSLCGNISIPIDIF